MFVSILILVVAVLIIVGSCATGKKAYVASENEELYGTWVTEYEGVIPVKWVLHPDGIVAWYTTETSTRAIYSGTWSIKEKWADDEGIIWYKVILKYRDTGLEMIGHTLIKISNSGKVMESAMKTTGKYPAIIDPNDLRVS